MNIIDTLLEQNKQLEQISQETGYPLEDLQIAFLKMGEWKLQGYPYGKSLYGYQKWICEQNIKHLL